MARSSTAGEFALSIAQINKIFQNKGCNIVVSSILGISVIAMLGYGPKSCGGANTNNAEDRQGRTVVTAGPLKVSSLSIDNVAEQQIQQQMASIAEQFKGNMDMARQLFDTPQMRFGSKTQALERFINEGLALKLAQAQGIDLSDDSVKKQIVQAATQSYHDTLMQQGKLKPGASQLEFETAFKDASKRNFSDQIKDITTELDKRLSGTGKEEVEASVVLPMLIERYKAKFQPTDDQLKKTYDTYTVKRITINSASAAEGAPAKAEKVLKEIKSGLAFEQAMQKYSNEPPPPGKKLADVTTDVAGASIALDPQLKLLESLKPGEVSGVAETTAGTVIYKLIKKTSTVPKTFEQDKARLRNDYARQEAQKQVGEDIKKLDTPENVKWESDGYHVLHDLARLQDSANTAPDKDKQMLALVDRALSAQSDPVGADVAISVAKAAMDAAWASASADAKKTLQPKRIEVLTAYATHMPDVRTKIELVDALLEAKDPQAGPALIDAAQTNSVHTDSQGQGAWSSIQGDKLKMTHLGLLKLEEVKQIDDLFAQWTKDYKAQQALDAERAAEQKKLELENTPKAPAPKKPAPKPEAKKPAGKK